MNRALGVLTVGAFLTLVIGVVGSGGPLAAVALGAGYTVLGTVGFWWVRRRGRLGWSVAYVAVQLLLALATFALDPGVATTLFLVVLVSQCVLVLPRPATVVVIVLVPFVHAPMESWQAALREGVGLFAAVVFAAVITELLQREQRARRELAEAHEQLRDYAAQAERLATAQERNRVARDIHDGLGHLAHRRPDAGQGRAGGAADATRPRSTRCSPRRSNSRRRPSTTVRRSVRALREPRSTAPLPEALKALTEEISAAGVPTRFAVSGTVRPLPDEAQEALYRAAQEGLTNVRKHARATRADLLLDYGEARGPRRGPRRRDGHRRCAVAGLRPGRAAGAGRAPRRVGFEVDSARDEGVTLTMEVPG